MQSNRVIATISMIVRTPLPSPPTIHASAPRNSVSLEAFETLPIFRFRRSTCKGFLVPSGRQRGSRKHANGGDGLRPEFALQVLRPRQFLVRRVAVRERAVRFDASIDVLAKGLAQQRLHGRREQVDA